ncbi:Re/Si-specific NAD(P)(+) transhydrogenase subunit alpha [Sandaracinus amylolyticus]|nr:Re/Si-specific NAD(P)(+) transhydrogenase subunit alpha [Sandaracinus amylolyticus]
MLAVGSSSHRSSRGRGCAIRIGIPRETRDRERRIAATPESVVKLRELGFDVLVERGAGREAGHDDEAYVAAGATLGDTREALGESDVVLKVRPPTDEEARALREGAVLISLVQPERHPDLVATLAARKVSALALERVPRVTRAQKMDVLSSQANLAGYRAVVEAAAHYQGFFGPQVTAAGTTRPARVLVIGAGVAGLAAIGAARALGAEVRAFDTRAAAREQVESLGAKFLEVELKESGEGAGGYAKVMSEEFIEAEMRLFRAQAAEVNVIVTTALVPGAKAPLLVPRDVVEALEPGSIVVDMAAEQGGNCELCVPDQVVDHGGVKILGFTDLASRMARAASKFFAMNLVHLVAEMRDPIAPGVLRVDLENDVIRPAMLTHGGEVLPPPPRKEPSPATPAPVAKTEREPSKSTRPPPPEGSKPRQTEILNPARRAWGTTLAGMAIIGALFALGRFAPGDFLQHFTVFILACFVGWQVIWSVTPALHTPLMSVTNAISGIIVVGGMLQIGEHVDLASVLGAIAVLVAAINVSGGFLVTHRMLRMFRKDESASSSAPKKGGHGR